MQHHSRDVTLWVASLVFVLLGVVEIVVGQLIASHVLLVLGVHNIFDGGLLALNAKAETWEHASGYSRRRCQLAPLFALGSSSAILLSSIYTGWVSHGSEKLLAPLLALGLGLGDITLNQVLAKRLGDHQHHVGGNRWAARMHLYGDVVVGWIGIGSLLLVIAGITEGDNLGGLLGSLFIIVMSTWMIIVSIQNYRRHLPRHHHAHLAADHHHG